jgi:septum formation protein
VEAEAAEVHRPQDVRQVGRDERARLVGRSVVSHEQVEFALSSSEVQLKKLSPEEIAQYAASGEGDDKAGAYAIQGRAGRFVVELRGSYSGVMGLPLYETSLLLDKLRGRNTH